MYVLRQAFDSRIVANALSVTKFFDLWRRNEICLINSCAQQVRNFSRSYYFCSLFVPVPCKPAPVIRPKYLETFREIRYVRPNLLRQSKPLVRAMPINGKKSGEPAHGNSGENPDAYAVENKSS